MKLKVALGASSIREAKSQLEELASGMQGKADELCRRLAEVGVKAAVSAVGRDETGELRGSIRFERRGEREYVVVAACGHAVYVEFGTGVVGAENAGSYPGERPGWASAPLSRTTQAREDGKWTYFDEYLGRFVDTRGQRPQGFMAHGAEAMRQQVAAIAKEVFEL